jgi:hypothetical protein
VLYDVAVVYPNVDKMRLKEFKGEIEVPKPETKKLGGATAAKPAGGTPPSAGGGGLVGLRSAAAVAAKPAAKPVGKLTLKVVSTTNDLPDKLVDIIAQDPAYQNPNAGYGQISNKGEAVEFTLTAGVFKRKPTDYTRRLDAKFPPVVKPLAPPAEPDTDFQEQP